MTKGRLETFSDSVIAIVITLLAFELKISLVDSTENVEALKSLKMLAPQFLIFTLSFLTISIMWINHHYITNKIETVNHRTVWANSFLLFCIALIPFATAFLGSNPSNQIALITYSIVMLVASFAFSLLKNLSLPKNTHTHEKEIFRHVGIYSYTLAVFVAFYYPPAAYIILLIPPLSYTFPSKN